MICPDCHTDNIDGADTCESCGADLRNLDLPSPESEFEEHLMHDPLGVVGARDALAIALHKMSVGGFRHLPLVPNDGEALVVSIQDLFRHISHFIPARS